MNRKPRLPIWLGMFAAVGLTAGHTTMEAQAIRGCANPAGQFRIIGATESCRAQETLVVSGGVMGGGDHGPIPPNGPANLSSATTTLTTENVATGFSGYMVWANVAVEFNSGDTVNGIMASPTSASCAITYTVTGRTGTFRADGRSVAFPASALGAPNRIVRLNIGLNGITGSDPTLTPALTAADVVDFSLTCRSNAGPNPPANQVPVRVMNYSLTGIGITKTFGQ